MEANYEGGAEEIADEAEAEAEEEIAVAAHGMDPAIDENNSSHQQNAEANVVQGSSPIMTQEVHLPYPNIDLGVEMVLQAFEVG